MHPLVSIVIPAYNGARELRRVIPMLDAQTYAPLEIVVVDDGSVDDTPDALAELARERSHLCWVRQDNAGAGAARNRGIAEARGEFIAFLDCDDVWPDNAVEARMKPFLEQDDPEIMGVYCPADFIDEHGEKLLEGPLFDYSLPFDRMYFTSVTGSAFAPTCVILRRSALDLVGGFREELSPAEDFDLWQRMLRTGGCFLKVRSCRVGWVQHPASTVHTRLGFHHAQCVEVLDQMYKGLAPGPCLPEYSGPMGDVLARRDRVNRALGAGIMAAASGHRDTARELAREISLPFVRLLSVDGLMGTVRFNILRVLCRRESEWPENVWPEVAPRVLPWLRELDADLGGCRNLRELIRRLSGLPDGGKA
ncbi:glycosyltransferase family 2 protein [Pseudodesulfovibrio tunisiensis]|uniref:glycosyltransferase family 2 protein n=1 Tax=Pseudodesulfovibrio tunisiensis TaxID=463192 RepID=UPI001FB207DD|nr:glycosyltransferase family A protein [Pseudodesulfovibrio tunisiensis]